jgi:chloramphenicol O-acetyltransferase
MLLPLITRGHDYNQDFAQRSVCVCVFYVGKFYNINGVPEEPLVVTAVHVAGRTVLARKQDPSVIFGIVMLI